jgi:hypothetical protein
MITTSYEVLLKTSLRPHLILFLMFWRWYFLKFKNTWIFLGNINARTLKKELDADEEKFWVTPHNSLLSFFIYWIAIVFITFISWLNDCMLPEHKEMFQLLLDLFDLLRRWWRHCVKPKINLLQKEMTATQT